MPQPICVECQTQMRCTKNDQLVHDRPVPRFVATYWLGDKFQCPACLREIVTGFGSLMMTPPRHDASAISFGPGGIDDSTT